MKTKLMLVLTAVFIASLLSAPLESVELKKSRSAAFGSNADLDVSLHLIGGKGSVLRSGHELSLTFQTNKDAYVIIYNIDSEGYVHLLYPEKGDLQRVTGRKSYFLPKHGSGVIWEVGDKTGIEYIHAIAVERAGMINEDELYFLAQNRRLGGQKQFRVDMDPLLAFNMIDEELLTNPSDDLISTDYTYFYINRRVDYPRFLCSKCHSAEKLSDPYAMECPEIIIEKATYDEDVGYPYPALFQVRHVDAEDEDYYATDYADNLSQDWDDGYDDTSVYLSIYYNDYYHPRHHYRPYYGGYYVGFYDPFWWDDYYWHYGFGFGWHWAGYHYYRWPYYTWWWYPHHHYGGHYCSDWWYGRYGYCYDYHNRRYIHGDRTIAKRRLNYARTVSRDRRERVLSNSLLAKKRTPAARMDPDRSKLARRLSRGTIDPAARMRSRSVPTRDLDVKRRVVYGTDRTSSSYRRARDADRTRETRSPRSPTIKTDKRNRGNFRRSGDSVKDRSRDGRSGDTDNSSKARRSSGAVKDRTVRRKESSSTGRSTSRSRSSSSRSSSSKSGSSVRKRNSSSRSSGSNRSTTVRRSSSSSRRSSSQPARSSSRSSSSGSSSRSSKSSGGSSRAKKR
jgi:hypothetical protein